MGNVLAHILWSCIRLKFELKEKGEGFNLVLSNTIFI